MTRNLGAYIPPCVCYDPWQLKNLSDAEYLLKHEIDLFEEGEDGALSAGEIKQVREALARLIKDWGGK